MSDGKRDENIKDILELIKENPASVTEQGVDGSYEMSFKNESSGGLIFEREEIAAPEREEAGPAPLAAEPQVTEPPKKAEPRAAETVVPAPPAEEFNVPDSYRVNTRYDTPATPDTKTRIFTTYVPRFTEVSETYRMSDDPRPVTADAPRPVARRTVAVEETKSENNQKPDAPHLDPTAEIDSEVKEAVVVNLGKGEESDAADTLKVFKFSERESAPAEKRERTADDERADLKKLITPDEPTPEPTPEPEEVEEEIAEPAPAPMPEPPKNTTIPDPDDGKLSVVDYTSRTVAPRTPTAPDGVSDTDVAAAKKHSGEFTHQLQRDGFKDSFLDSRMSVRIRAIAAAIITALLLVAENLWLFGLNVAELLHVNSVPGALAIIDLQFAICLFVLAIPELIRAFRYLFRGRLLPEISLAVGLAVLTCYTVVIVIEAPATYPLYGFIFAIGVILAIVAAYYRIGADFTAFRLVSKNSEKRFIDKKLTRTLTEENIALDGAIDEYNSSTARLFRAAFITDFFKRTARSAESTAHNLILVTVSLGASVVLALVTFFLPGGTPVLAVSAFALTYLLSVPAVAILDHKITYADSQRTALAEDSTAVGETAYLDYSGVDVVAFRDTEIFGPDDVNLKRFMLYGDRDSMEKAMRQMSSLFAVVGGPLDHIFSSALEKRCHPASSPIIETDGLSGDVDGRRIAAGTEEYMIRHGIRIPDGAVRQENGGIDTTKVMYASENGEVYAKFYIRYSFSEEFTSILPSLKESGIFPLIYTRDPNVSNELLRRLSAGADCMRVMKRLHHGDEDDPLYRRVSAGMVTYGDKLSAINMLLLSKKYVRISRIFGRIETASMAVGIVASAILSLAVASPIPSVAFGLWQILLASAVRLVSRLTLGRSGEHKH